MNNKYLFIGDINGEGGPQNVNKGITSNLSSNFIVVKGCNKVLRYLYALRHVINSKVVIISGLSGLGSISMKLAKILHKKTIYIMHGCYDIECQLNDNEPIQKYVQMERDILFNIDLILTVSKSFGDLISNEYPFCKGKISFLHNGVEKLEKPAVSFAKCKNKIIAVGGYRKVKNNIIVANAINNNPNLGNLVVYGTEYHPEIFVNTNRVQFKDRISQKKLYDEYMSSELYVLNSIYEPFALTVFEALNMGCSILVSHHVGAIELLNLTENDIIYDPMDEKEIATKINYILNNPNNERIVKSIDFASISYKAEAKKLEEICENLCKG